MAICKGGARGGLSSVEGEREWGGYLQKAGEQGKAIC